YQQGSLLVTNLMAERLLASDMSVSLDETLWNFAKAEEKIMLGIEDFEAQVRLMQRIPVDLQLKSLKSAIANISKFRKATLRTTDIYQQGDIFQLYQLTKKSLGKMRKIMLYERNRNMATRIEKLSAEQHLFAAIGAAHLAGEKGVIKLLKASGLKLRPERIG
ncbi:MAG: TraB/GumN family protein, partial [Bacteroidota bacterium]